MQIGSHTFSNRIALAPMAGVTDEPFRQVCIQAGAGITYSEMLSSDHRLWSTDKSAYRLKALQNNPDVVQIVQLVGNDPNLISESAKRLTDMGAHIIDINMGCPAKKVCKKAAGSALMGNPATVNKILNKTVQAIDIPVTLKIRTGLNPANKNAIEIARIAEDSGVQAITVHGRTRACKFEGEAEYETIAKIKHAISIPVIANGDISNGKKAQLVLDLTNADGIMVGRAALGNPWIFREIKHYLDNGNLLTPPTKTEVGQLVSQHIRAIHNFYDDVKGVKFARKHMSWYLQNFCNATSISKVFNSLSFKSEQENFLEHLFMSNLYEQYA